MPTSPCTAVLLSLLSLAGCGDASGRTVPAASSLPPGFWDTWGDGNAEIDAYRLTTPRYGELRAGYAVLVFVTETFTAGQRVKSDGGHDDEFPVLKLNELRRFQTGIYDYALMTSTFAPLDGRLPLGQPTKVSFGSQEWCGALFDELVVDPGRAHRSRRSYFDGEADLNADMAFRVDTIFEDTLPIVARGILGEVPTGERDVLPTLREARLAHEELSPTRGSLSQAAGAQTVTVPAGTFVTREVTLTTSDGPRASWQIEEAAPHRIVRWTRSDGEVAELVGSARRPYWKEHDPGDEALLAELGLKPPEALR